MQSEAFADVFSECTQDVRDYEVLRGLFALQNAESDNERAQAIKTQLAESACKDCKIAYL